MSRPPGGGRFVSVQAARGVAALLVTFYHAQGVVRSLASEKAFPFGGFFAFGHSGVEFFFVLSGFIIYYVHVQDLNKPKRLQYFFWKRFARIYPLFLFVMVFVTAKSLIRAEFTWINFLKTVFLFPQPPYPMLIVSWTLVFEVVFYIVFGMSILSVMLGRFFLAVWLAASIWSVFAQPEFSSGFPDDVLRVLASPYNLLFFIGMVVAGLTKHARPVPFSRSLAISGAVFFVIAGICGNLHWIKQGGVAQTLLFGVFSGILLLGLVSAERVGRLRVGEWGNLLGDMSYPLYLVHGAVISVAVPALFATGVHAPGWILMLASIFIACGTALLLNRRIEKPMERALKKMSLSRKVVSPVVV